jgi:hypothetical protein
VHPEVSNDGQARLLGPLPRYPRLVDDLLAVQPGVYSPVAAYVCAVAAGWVYAEQPRDVITTWMDRLGLVGARCRVFAVHNDVMLVAATAVLVQSACGRVVILCYRGTEPRNLASWMADLDVNPTLAPMRASTRGDEALVHLGFSRNLQVTWDDVAGALGRAAAGQAVDERADGSLRPLQALFVTGHSLGAAMAALAGVRLATGHTESPRFRSKLRGIYTFGQPFVGNPAFAAVCSDDPLLRRGLFRHVYRNDVVPHLPGRSFGKFAHFGREFRLAPGLRWEEHTKNATQAPDTVLSMFVVPTLTYWASQLASTRRLGRLGYSWYDHLPQFYIEATTPRR